MNFKPSAPHLALHAVTAAAILAALGGCESWYRYETRTGGSPGQIDGPPPADPTEEQRQVEEQVEEAHAARESGDYGRALELFREILAQNPTVTTAYIGIGDVHMEQGDYTAAEPAYARAARLEPRNFDAQFGHGSALQMLGRFDDAARAYHRALVITPDSAKANRHLATTYLQLDEPASARVFAEKSVELEPDNGPARINLGAIYDKLGLHNEAVEEFRTAMELVEPTPELIMNLVQALSNAKRYRETIEAAEQLNRLEPSANAYERIGHAWFRLKDYDKSMQAYQEAVGVDPEHWPSWNGIGVNALNAWLLSKKRDSDSRAEAGEALRQSLRLNASQPKIIQLMTTYRL